MVYKKLNNGVSMPLLGMGCWDMRGEEAVNAVEKALHIGYRLIDTASMYENEKEVGQAIKKSDIDRKELFVTTKVNNADQGYDSTLNAYNTSLKKLDLDYVDLYLVHWPIKGKRQDTWRALQTIYQEGRVRAIGVCNYLNPFLDELLNETEIIPAVNQCEFYPYLFNEKLLKKCNDHGILLQAWSPLLRGKRMNDHKLLQMAKKYHETPAQILLRWDIEHEISTIPKSSDIKRLKENFAIFDFSMSEADILEMDSWNEDYRMSGEDPMIMF